MQERNHYKAMCDKLLAEREPKTVGSAIQTKQEYLFLALKLYRDAGLGFRADSRVLKVLSEVLGLAVKAFPQTIINWVDRLAIMRIQIYAPAPSNRGKSCDPLTHGQAWLIDVSIALSSAKIFMIIAIHISNSR